MNIIYREIDTPEEMARAVAVIQATGLYPEVDLDMLTAGGPLLAAIDTDPDPDVIAACIFTIQQRQSVYLDYLAVHPSYQGQGGDFIMYQNAMQYLQDQGLTYAHGQLYDENGDPFPMYHPDHSVHLDENATHFYRVGEMLPAKVPPKPDTSNS